jgi:hypothetical protein
MRNTARCATGHDQPESAVTITGIRKQHLFLGPYGGSLKLVSGTQLVQVISSEAPLARAMLGKFEGGEVSIQVALIRQQFEVLRVY